MWINMRPMAHEMLNAKCQKVQSQQRSLITNSHCQHNKTVKFRHIWWNQLNRQQPATGSVNYLLV